MIAVSICILGILLLLLQSIYFPIIAKYNTYTISKDSIPYVQYSYKRILAFWITFFLLALLCFIPIIKQVSIVRLLYSYFDAPSFLAIILICIACIKKVLLPYIQINHNMLYVYNIQFNVYCAYVLFLYGSIFYGGVLGFVEYDIYHLAILWQGIIGFIILISLYICSSAIGILGLLALILFYLFGSENVSFLESFICPYLWLYCASFIILKSCVYCYHILVKS